MTLPPDPSEFAVAVAIGYGHVLDKVVSFLERTSSSPVVAVSLALPVLAAYLVVATLAFAVRVAADGYVHIVACSGGGNGEEDDAVAARVLAFLSPAAVFGWVAGAVLKLAVYIVLLGALAATLLHYFAQEFRFTAHGLAKAKAS